MADILLLTLHKWRKNFQVGPPLGLLTMGAVLRQAGHSVRLLDLRARTEPLSMHLDAIRASAPDVIGLSAVIFDAAEVHAAAAQLKQLLPESRIVVGGPYVSSNTADVLAAPGVDAIVVGEGEFAFRDLVEAWARGEDRPTLPGVGYPGDGAIPPFARITDLDALPLPAWDLVDVALYHRRPRHGYMYRHKEYFSVLTSRGCPYHCIFCQCTFGHKYITRSAENVVDEVETLVREHGIREIHFVDDAFNLDLDRAKAVCDGILERGLDIAVTFPAGLRADRMDRELIDKLAAVGCFRIPYGVETASPRLQKMLKKNVNFTKLSEVIDATVDAGMIAQGFFMFGFPTETEAEVRQTIRFAVESRLHFATMNHVYALPGTELWQMAEQMGKITDSDPVNADYENPPMPMSEVSLQRMKALTRNAHLKFYFNPLRLWRIWRAMPHKRHFFGFFGLFLGKLFWYSGGKRGS